MDMDKEEFLKTLKNIISNAEKNQSYDLDYIVIDINKLLRKYYNNLLKRLKKGYI